MDALAYVAAVLTTAAFIPQIVKTWRTRSAEDLSLVMLCIHASGVALWLLYGVGLNSMPIVAANAATLVLDGVLVVLKWRFTA